LLRSKIRAIEGVPLFEMQLRRLDLPFSQ